MMFCKDFSKQILFVLSLLITSTTYLADARAAQLALNWADNSNNEDGFKVERKAGTTGTFAQVAMVPTNSSSYTDSNLTGGGTYCYRVRAYNTAGDSAYSNEACETASADTQSPTVSLTAPANGATVSGSSVTVSASASDNVGVVGVQFLLNGTNLGAEDISAPYSLSWNTTTIVNGTHSLAAVARDAAGNQATSATVTVTVSNQAPPPPEVSGLVAAYSFDEGSGTTVADSSGSGNTGTLSGATWTTQGKFGSALAFDGVNDWVTINDANSLDLTAGMTLEAWVYPTTPPTGWQTVIAKEMPSRTPYYLYASDDRDKPFTGIYTGAVQESGGGTGLAANIWTHLAGTYDGSQLRLYINGNQVASASAVGQILVSSGVLRIGGNSIWGEYFQGRIDNVRIYNRALTATEIQANMNTPVGTTPPPPPPSSFTLSVAKAGTGSGTVTSNSSGIDCGSDCTADYPEGEVVTLAASADADSEFMGWSGDPDCADGSVTMTADKNCTATFDLPPPPTFTLSVAKAGTGSGTVTSNSSGIDCGSDCTVDYPEGEVVTLIATPDTGSTFAGWSGDADCNDGSVTMTVAKSCTATFDLLPPPPPPPVPTDGVRIGVFRPNTGQWFLDVNGNGTMDDCDQSGCVAHFGESYERPVVGDWDGSGMTRIGVFDPNTRLWKLDRNADDVWEDGVDLFVGPFGKAGDLPVVGDWDGSGKTKIGVKRPTKSRWELDFNGNGKWDGCTVDRCGSLGGTVKPVVGDWNGLGDGLAKGMIGFFLPSKSQWQLDLNGNGAWNSKIDLLLKPFGQNGDLPVVGDWDGSGTAKIGVFDPATGLWELDRNGNGQWDGCAVDICLGPFGQQGDLPVIGNW